MIIKTTVINCYDDDLNFLFQGTVNLTYSTYSEVKIYFPKVYFPTFVAALNMRV